jgi:3-hydroxyacyl-[acyl-carrier-protein] dehydratase
MPGVNDLFSISKVTHENGMIRAMLGINKNSEILKGHFPGQPVIPGACMLQIVKEVLEDTLKQSLRLKKADHLKFLSMIDVQTTQSVQLDISYKIVDEMIGVNAKLSNGNAETVYFKFQGSFISLS